MYFTITIPMIVMYVAIAVFLWQAARPFLVIYIALFVSVALSQSYVCAYWGCPYIGGLGPCVGGFCLPSSQLARLFRNAKRSHRRYNLALSLASASLLGIIILPIYFLYQQNLIYLLLYHGIVLTYAISFLWLICPACETRHVCPGGQTSTKLREKLAG
jgi:hypothetical protein